MPFPINIAVISDLHVGTKARSKDLCPHDDVGDFYDENYVEKFINYINKEDITADYLILAGDISESAQIVEFQLASEKITQISDALNVEAQNIIFVPGNHDVDWEVLKGPGSKEERRGQRYLPLMDKELIFEKIISRAQDNFCKKPYFSIWNVGEIFILAFNSAWHDNPDISHHHGLVTDETIHEMRIKLEQIKFPPDSIKIFLTHHHPFLNSNPIPTEEDFSMMVNSENLIDLLNEYEFDLFIHGHRHCPNFRTHTLDSGFPLAVLGSGSFSHKLDSRWSGRVNNQFHMIEIRGRMDGDQTTYGIVNSWTYLCSHGWLPSGEVNGIDHKMYFGSYQIPAVFRNKIKPIVEALFDGRTFIKWSTVIEGKDFLLYMNKKRVLSALSGLGEDLGFVVHESLDGEILLLKE